MRHNSLTSSVYLLVLVTLVPLVAVAGPGHDHGHSHDHAHGHNHGDAHSPKPAALDDSGLRKAGNDALQKIVSTKHPIEKQILDESWLKIPEAAKSISKKGTGYAILKFENKSLKKSVYLLLSSAGEIFDANFSGEFKGLK